MSHFSPANGAVTFLDILGWKGIWQRDGEAITKLHQIVKSTTTKAKDYRGKTGLNKDVIVTSISDTIIILAEGLPSTTLEISGELIASIICEGIKTGLPIRGATSFGEYYYDGRSTIMGAAVDEAASWHESINWVGCIQTPSATIAFNNENSLWVSYEKIPYKSSEIRFGDGLALNWMTHWQNEENGSFIEFRKIVSNFSPLLPEISKYYMNAIDFYWFYLLKSGINANVLKKVWSQSHSFKVIPEPIVFDDNQTQIGSLTNNEWKVLELSDFVIKIQNLSSDQGVSFPLSQVVSLDEDSLHIRGEIHLFHPSGSEYINT